MKIESHSEPFPSRATSVPKPSGHPDSTTVAAAVGKAAPAPSQNEVKAAIEAANRAMQARGAHVQFSIDSDSGRTLVRVIDTETKQVLRQFPSEEMIAIARNIDRMRGATVEDVV